MYIIIYVSTVTLSFFNSDAKPDNGDLFDAIFDGIF